MKCVKCKRVYGRMFLNRKKSGNIFRGKDGVCRGTEYSPSSEKGWCPDCWKKINGG